VAGDLALRLRAPSPESCIIVVPTFPANANIARHLALMAARQPDHPALKIPRGRLPDGRIDYLALTFAELDAEVDQWCARLTRRGVRRGDRTLVMVRQGLPLIAAAFALFKLGAVPIVIDPGMGLKNFLACVARSDPRVLVGIPFAQVLSWVFRGSFRGVRVRVGASSSLVARLAPRSLTKFATVANGPDELAAILFTSGSTGAPKGVCYEHGMFDAQIRLIRAAYDIAPGEVDLPLLPVFALFNPALGLHHHCAGDGSAASRRDRPRPHRAGHPTGKCHQLFRLPDSMEKNRRLLPYARSDVADAQAGFVCWGARARGVVAEAPPLGCPTGVCKVLMAPPRRCPSVPLRRMTLSADQAGAHASGGRCQR